MTAQEKPNYPDILGAITGGRRINLDAIQCALALSPPQVAAGRVYEIILMVQNASDIDVDVIVTPELPVRDTAGNAKRFMLKSNRLRIGMRPAEVGFVTLPASTSPNTAPGRYPIRLNVDVKRVGKHPQRIRQNEGGGTYIQEEMPQESLNHLRALQTLTFSNESPRKGTLEIPLELLPPAVAKLKETEKKADWISLWSMRDLVDEFVIAKKVWPDALDVVEKLKRGNVFMPLLRTNQQRFAASAYPLHPPEAILITKIMTLVLELGIDEPTAEEPRPNWPAWFRKLCRVLFQDPTLATQIDRLVTQMIYGDLIHDAVLYGFTMISTVTDEQYGSEDETRQYADDIVSALLHTHSLDFARTYLPLTLSGLIANARVTMPREQIRETVFMLSKARDSRANEKNADNTFIFDLADHLISRALDGM